MRFDRRIVRVLVLLVASSLATLSVASAGDKKSQSKAEAAKIVDSGSFSIFHKGQRVATETFTVHQRGTSSIIKSELKETAGSDPTQKCSLEMSSAGELIRYQWNQSSGGSLTVVPNKEFLLEKISSSSSSKPAEEPFLLPSTSAILDNNFFIQREVLVWRYLAAACKPQGESMKCQQDPGDFGVLVPQDRLSMRVRLELVGKEKVSVRGTSRDLMRLNLKGDTFDWALWVDEQDQFKLIKVAIPADDTEVVRD